MKMTYPHVIYDQIHSSRLLLVLLCCTRGNCLLVKTCVGGDAVLPCEVDPTTDATDLAVYWSRLGLPHDQYVHFHRDGKMDIAFQNPSFKGRTSLFKDEVKKGNMSLKLSRVKSSDEGNYTCYIPELQKEFTIQLIVGNCLLVKTFVGGDAVLPCEVDRTIHPTIDPDLAVLWTRLDLPPHHYVHFQKYGQEVDDHKHSSYNRRTSLFMDELKKGNVSLKLSRVKSSDEGNYTCYIPEFQEEFTIQLIVEESLRPVSFRWKLEAVLFRAQVSTRSQLSNHP